MSDPIPDVLMRYGGPWLLNDLLKERISFAKISEYNDPFEAHASTNPIKPSLHDRTQTFEKNKELIINRLMIQYGWQRSKARMYYEKVSKKEIARIKYDPAINSESFNENMSHKIYDSYLRFSCFVSEPDSPLDEVPMWAYYSDCHRGVKVHICTESFKASEFSVSKMAYDDSPPIISFGSSDINILSEEVGPLWKTKGTCWSHEKEYRIMAHISKLQSEKDTSPQQTIRDYLKLDPAHILRIDLGIRATEETIAKAKELRNKHPHITTHQAVKASNAYHFDYKPLST